MSWLYLTNEADEPLFRGEVGTSGNFDAFGNLLQVIVVLTLIIALIIFLLRFVAKKSKLLHANDAMVRLAGIQLAQNKSLQLVECGNTLYLLGVGDNIQVIDKITHPDDVQYIKLLLESEQTSQAQGWAYIKQLFGSRNKQDHVQSDDHTMASFQEVLYNKMNRIQDDRRQRMNDWMQEEQMREREDKS